MSYDIELRARTGVLDMGEVRRSLASMSTWTVGSGGAVYQNEDTGVYFVLDLNDGDEGNPVVPEPGEPDFDEPPLVAVINLYRPSFFIREIEAEIRRIATAFDLQVFDPQHEQLAPDDLGPEWLSSRWWTANHQAHTAMASKGLAAHHLPERRLTGAWWWNLHRESVQQSYAEDVFVPKIMALAGETGVRTAVVWTDAIPFILPEVDDVMVYRDRLAPRRMMRSQPDFVLLTRDEVIAGLGASAVPLADRVEYRSATIPPAIERWVKDLRPRRVHVTGVPWDDVHDAELVGRAAHPTLGT